MGPPLSHFEMSFGDGMLNARTFMDIADKLLTRKALSTQRVHKQDSLLASLRDTSHGYYSKGLKLTYTEMIQTAFKEKFWNSTDTVEINGETRTLIRSELPVLLGCFCHVVSGNVGCRPESIRQMDGRRWYLCKVGLRSVSFADSIYLSTKAIVLTATPDQK